MPFGQQYLELLAIVDEDQARSSPQGRPVVAALSAHGPGLARWSVESRDIEATAARLGQPIERRQRVRPDATVVTWRSVAVDTAWSEPWRCAFMAWDDPETHPARSPAVHPNGATGFARLDVVVPDMAQALEWLGGPAPAGLGIEVGPRPGPARLSLSSPAGDIAVA